MEYSQIHIINISPTERAKNAFYISVPFSELDENLYITIYTYS